MHEEIIRMYAIDSRVSIPCGRTDIPSTIFRVISGGFSYLPEIQQGPDSVPGPGEHSFSPTHYLARIIFLDATYAPAVSR